jgi:hypothetical protein
MDQQLRHKQELFSFGAGNIGEHPITGSLILMKVVK